MVLYMLLYMYIVEKILNINAKTMSVTKTKKSFHMDESHI
jgi:hypothetical protein